MSQRMQTDGEFGSTRQSGKLVMQQVTPEETSGRGQHIYLLQICASKDGACVAGIWVVGDAFIRHIAVFAHLGSLQHAQYQTGHLYVRLTSNIDARS